MRPGYLQGCEKYKQKYEQQLQWAAQCPQSYLVLTLLLERHGTAQNVAISSARDTPKKQVAYNGFDIAASGIFYNGRVGKGISAPAAHRTVLESLPSHGSSH